MNSERPETNGLMNLYARSDAANKFYQAIAAKDAERAKREADIRAELFPLLEDSVEMKELKALKDRAVLSKFLPGNLF